MNMDYTSKGTRYQPEQFPNSTEFKAKLSEADNIFLLKKKYEEQWEAIRTELLKTLTEYGLDEGDSVVGNDTDHYLLGRYKTKHLVRSQLEKMGVAKHILNAATQTKSSGMFVARRRNWSNGTTAEAQNPQDV